jgi:hypothetical protein
MHTDTPNDDDTPLHFSVAAVAAVAELHPSQYVTRINKQTRIDNTRSLHVYIHATTASHAAGVYEVKPYVARPLLCAPMLTTNEMLCDRMMCSVHDVLVRYADPYTLAVSNAQHMLATMFRALHSTGTKTSRHDELVFAMEYTPWLKSVPDRSSSSSSSSRASAVPKQRADAAAAAADAPMSSAEFVQRMSTSVIRLDDAADEKKAARDSATIALALCGVLRNIGEQAKDARARARTHL